MPEPMPEPTLARGRFERREIWAIVAADTFDPLVERIRGVLGHDRRMVRIRRYASTTGADNLDIRVGLRLDPDLRDGEDPIKVTASTFPGPTRHLDVRLTCAESFGFSADDRTERALRGRYDQRGKTYDTPVTAVRIDGWPDSPSRDDRIEIERWNEHRVCSLTTIAFQADWD